MASAPKQQKKQATAIAIVELEIQVESCWGDECTVGQVYKQAEDGALGLLNQAFAAVKASHRVSLKRKPQITAVMAPRGF